MAEEPVVEHAIVERVADDVGARSERAAGHGILAGDRARLDERRVAERRALAVEAEEADVKVEADHVEAVAEALADLLHGVGVVGWVNPVDARSSRERLDHVRRGLLGELDPLEAEAGLIEESDERPDADLDDERRRYYRLTGVGQRVVRAEARRYADMTAVARGKKLIGRPAMVLQT